MRGKFSLAYMEANFDLIFSNPIRRTNFFGLCLIQCLEILFIPLQYIFTTHSEGNLIARLIKINNSNSIYVYLIIAMTFQFLTITLYILALGSKYIKLTQQHHKINEQIDLDNKENFRKKFTYNLIIILIFINMFVLSLPNRILSYKVIFSTIIEKKSTGSKVLVLAIINILQDVVLEVIQHIFMQTRLPIHKYIPFALADPKLQYYMEMVLYLFAISNAMPQHIALWCNTTLILFAFLSYFTVNTFYDTLTNHAAKMRQTSLLSSIIISATCLGRPDINSHVFIIFLALFVVNFFFLKLFYMLRSKQRILFDSNNMQTAKDGQILIWCIESLLLVNQDTKIEFIKTIFIKLQTILLIHKNQCNDQECFCQKPKYNKMIDVSVNNEVTLKNFHKVKVMTLEILLRRVFENINKASVQKNCQLGIILVFEVFQSQKTPFSCMYNLQKFHDCSTCSLTDCFQQYMIQRMMIFHVNSQSQNAEEIQKYQKLINFEQSFKRYLEVIDQNIEETKNLWGSIEKKEIDIKQATKIGEQLVEKYKEFNEVYSGINKMCGEIILIESMALRLNREILQFEQEAFNNQEKIIQIRSKQRLIRVHQQEQNFLGKDKNHLVVIGGNQKNFQQILNVSKSFVIFVGFTYEFLIKNKCCCFLPKTIDYEHENILKKYLKKKSILNQKVLLKQQWIKTRNGTLHPVAISVIPRIDIKDGITMVALVSKQKEITINDQNVKSNSVFCIICDLNNKIAHVSENCLVHLGFVDSIEVHDIYINSIIQGLPEQLVNDTLYSAVLDMTPFQAYMGDTQQQNYNSKMYSIMVHYNERIFSALSVIKLFTFVVIANTGTVSMDFNEQTQIPINIQLFGSDGKKNISYDKTSLLQIYSSVDEELGSIQSVSSTSSRSSSHNTQEAQIMEIKSILEFDNLPISLKKYRVYLIIGFIILLSTAIALMIVNIESKASFIVDIDSLREMKIMKNTLSVTKLAIVYIMAISNIPKNLNTTLTNYTSLYIDSYEDLLFSNLNKQIYLLHNSLTSFSQNSAIWDQSFVYLVSKDKLVADKVTQEGNHVQVNTTFFKTMTLQVEDISYLANLEYYYYKFNNTINIWNTTYNIKWFQKMIKGKDEPLNSLLQYFFLCVYNGSGFLLKQILNIDANFLQQILNHGDGIINVIMIFTVTCCIVIFIVVALYIPYLFRVFTVHKQILEFICLSDHNQLKTVILSCNTFQKFLKKNLMFNQQQENHTSKKAERNSNKLLLLTNSHNQINSTSFQNDQETTTQQQVQTTSQNMITSHTNNDDHNEQIKFAFIKDQQTQMRLNIKKSNKNLEKTLNPNDSQLQNTTQLMMLKKQETDSEEEDNENDGTRNHGRKNKKDNKLEISQSIDYQLIQKQTNMRKITVVVILMIIAVLIGVFYIGTYVISKDVLETYQNGFYEYDIFFTRSSCISETYFLTQKAILFNDSLTDDTEIGRNIDYMMTQCLVNENKYREIKKSGDGMFKSIDAILKKFDSSGICDYLTTQLNLDSRCSIEGNDRVIIFIHKGYN